MNQPKSLIHILDKVDYRRVVCVVCTFTTTNTPILENRESVGKSLKEVEKRFPDGVPLLDPVEDMKIKEADFEETVRKIEVLEQRLVSEEG